MGSTGAGIICDADAECCDGLCVAHGKGCAEACREGTLKCGGACVPHGPKGGMCCEGPTGVGIICDALQPGLLPLPPVSSSTPANLASTPLVGSCPKVFVYRDLKTPFQDIALSYWLAFGIELHSTPRITSLQHNLGYIFLYRMLSAKHCITKDPAKADLFYIPLLVKPKAIAQWIQACGKLRGKAAALHLNNETAKKHFFLHIAEEDEYPRLYTAPYPTSLRVGGIGQNSLVQDMTPWNQKMPRKQLVSFIGAFWHSDVPARRQVEHWRDRHKRNRTRWRGGAVAMHCIEWDKRRSLRTR